MTPPAGPDRTRSVPFDRVADRYDDTRGGIERGSRFAEALAPYLRPQGRVLEVGIGTGTVGAALRDLGWQVCGVDLSFPMLWRARDRLGPRVAVGDAHGLPVRDHAVEDVVVVWVLHVVADVFAVLWEVHRVLARRGRLAIVPGRPWYREDDIGDVMEGLDPLLASPADAPERLVELGREAGLEPLHLGDCGVAEFEQSPEDVASWLERRDPSWVWDLDAHAWRTVVQPVIDGLRTLPEPDRPRRRANRHSLLVLERR